MPILEIKKIYICVTVAAAMLSLAVISCSNEDMPNNPESSEGRMVEIRLTADMAGASVTPGQSRAHEIFTGTAFTGSSIPFGICLAQYGTTDAVMTGTGNMKSEYYVDPKTWIYHFDGEEHERISIREGLGFSIYAYYPHIEKDFDGTDFSIENVPFTFGASDYMWASPVSMSKEEISAALVGHTVSCNLEFKHIMSCIRLMVKCNRSSSLRLSEIIMADTKADSEGALIYEKGHFNAKTGDIAPGEADKKEIHITGYDTELKTGVYTPVYILIPPIEGYSDKRFEVTLKFYNAKGTVSFYLPAITDDGLGLMDFKRQHMYTYNIDFDNTITFIEPGSETDWSTGETTRISL